MSVSHSSSLGQLLIIGLHDHRWSRSLERMLRAQQPSGVLLFPGSLRAPGQTAELLHKIARTMSNPPFLAIAEEGGSVNPLKAFLPPLPAPRVLARQGLAAVRRSGELIGAALQLLGFNLEFAPRLDLSNPRVKPALDAQTFGTDPKQVAQCGKAFIEGLRKHKILACGKHFPGRGVPESDERGVPVVGKTMVELWREDLLPFRDLLPLLPLIELSNISYKAYDFDAPRPAACSANVVNGLLRTKLGYRGLAIADLLEHLEDASRHVAANEAAMMRFDAFPLSTKAGCDLQVIRWGEGTADRFLRGIRKGLETGSLSHGRVAEALRRIQAVKKGFHRPSGKLRARSFGALGREFDEFSELIRRGGTIDE